MTHHPIESLEQRTLLSAQLLPGAVADWNVTGTSRAAIDDDATLAGRPGGGGGNGGGGGGSTANPEIAFATSKGALKVMNADGSNHRLVWGVPDGDFANQPRYPTWHPSGDQILFQTQVEGRGLYRISLDGTSFTKLISLNGPFTETSDHAPLPGSNGLHRIAFTDSDPDDAMERNIFVANEAGSGRTQLTFNEANLYPSWSPDGDQIAYVHIDLDNDPPLPGAGLRLMTLSEDAAGNVTVATDVLLVPYGEEFQGVILGAPEDVAFSKTQNRVYFIAPTLAPITASDDIWAWDLDTSQLRQVTATPDAQERWVSSSADDSKIVYEIGGVLYTANSDGSGRAALPKAKGEKNVVYHYPSFKRAPVAATMSSPASSGLWSSKSVESAQQSESDRVAEYILAGEIA